jgi:phosphatidylglycerophosphatase C
MTTEATAVFDLDGALLDGDSTTAWMIGRFKRSLPRLLMALAVAPAALPLALSKGFRRLGGSIFFWVASVGWNESRLRASFARFAERLAKGELSVDWRAQGVAVLRSRLAHGERVVIATAAPFWLAKRLAAQIGPEVAVVGSGLRPFLGGWIADRHCAGSRKCEMLNDAGYGICWANAYSDSLDDLPMLRRAEQAWLVNASQPVRAAAAKSGVGIRHLAW